MSLIKMMLVMVSVAAISKTFGLLRFLLRLDRKSGSAGMPRPISYAVFCLKKKKKTKKTVHTKNTTPIQRRKSVSETQQHTTRNENQLSTTPKRPHASPTHYT